MSDDKHTVTVTEADLKMIIAALNTVRADYCTTREDEDLYFDLAARLEKQWPDTSSPVAANIYYASIGTVSHATLRQEDLIPAFANELKRHVQNNEFCSDYKHERRVGHLDLIKRAAALEHFDTETANYVFDDLCDALCEFAAPGCYFGCHPGDGSDFGFWPMEEDEVVATDIDTARSAT